MSKHLIPVLCLVFFLSACERGPTDIQKFKENNSNKSLDLRITPEILKILETQPLLNHQSNNEAEPPAMLDLQQSKTESRIKLNGEIFYDKSSDDYIRAIDGGIINLEFKFK